VILFSKHKKVSPKLPFFKNGVGLLWLLVFFSGICHWLEAADEPVSPSGVATAEVIRRKQMLEQAQTMIQAGSLAQSEQDYGGALDNFRAAFELLPEAPAVEATRKVVFKRYQSAAVQYAQQMIDQAQWPQARQVLQDVLTLGNEAGYGSSMDPGLKRMLANLEDPDYYPTVLSPQHIKNVERVKQLLIVGQGYLDYGNYDQAAKSFNQALLIDRYNSAARRGLEDVERHKMNHYAVARDQTRATKLREVAEGWEMPVPRAIGPDSDLITAAPAKSRRQSLEEKLKTIILPSIELQAVRLGEALELLRQRSVELDFAETDFTLKGINLNLDTASFAAGENPGEKIVSFKLSNVPLGDTLKYLTQQTGTAYQVDDYSVRVLSLSGASQKVMENRTWTVPPGFLGSSGLGNGAPQNADPFGNADQGGAGGQVLVKRKTAREFLEENGILFGDGAVANYNPATSTLLVRNTPEQLAIIDNLVQAAREGVNKMVEVSLKIISITEDKVKQLGVDSLLGPSNIGSSPRVFTSGGTLGANSANDVTFVNPGGTPVGIFPISSSLRTGNLQTATSIDDLLSATPPSQFDNAPAVFSVGGVFTDPQFQAVLRMFTQSKGTDFLCDTKLLIRPGQRGKVEMIREFIYPTEYDPPEISAGTFTDGSAGVIVPAVPTAFEMRAVGKTIEVEPTVAADNHTVSLDLSLDFTEFMGFVDYGTPIYSPAFLASNGPPAGAFGDNRILMPVFDVVRETTNVTLWDGQTVPIGGIHGHTVTDTQDKIPFVGDLPVLGKLFRSTTEDHRKTAIFIFATVRLIDPAGMPINAPGADESPNEFPPRSNLPKPAEISTPQMSSLK
jgi:general secretion pathway protein D